MLLSPEYQECANWISQKRQKKVSWEDLMLACQDNDDELRNFLKRKVYDDDWPEMNIDTWKDIVSQMQEDEDLQVDIRLGNDGAIYNRNYDNGLSVPTLPSSCWQQYKRKLSWPEESIRDLENATKGILRRLNKDTTESGPVKGLVIGHVQSGKTANMEALMEMAADHGWNYFILLSGTIENLRRQTVKRIQTDFSHYGNLVWLPIENPSKHYNGSMPDFSKVSRMRYYTVCLKNATRLKNLIDWIHKTKAIHDDMRILIIDDEADQASISNTAVEMHKEQKERKGINKLIVNLVDDVHYKEEKTNGKAKAVNYVMYTATPYANFLNESSEKSLYPKDFIWTLKTSDEYIGPEQIFGSENPEVATEDGLDIKRTVPESDLEVIKDIYETGYRIPPVSLQDAICWFICCVAVMRKWDYKKPVSMLVHTSQKQDHHAAIAETINEWISAHQTDDLFEMCKKIYEKETAYISKTDWLQQIGQYGVPADKIQDYPSFEEIQDYLKEILSMPIQHIRMNEDGDLEYHRGLHLVIDNCAHNGIYNGEDHIRLAYPDPQSDKKPDFATAFIIVGGSTLARGLTIEGLVSTFFLRSSCQADTLMQMGRWFGYRRGYELLPRIWMTEDTTEKFEFLSKLETDLRADLIKYMMDEIRPDQYAPRILASPRLKWMSLTSKKHMTNAVAADMDYSGARPQTTIFDRDKNIQEYNIRITDDFLSRLQDSPGLSASGTALYWQNVPLDLISEDFLYRFRFCERSRVLNEIQVFCEWLKNYSKEKSLDNWTVIVAGKDKVAEMSERNDRWNVKGYSVGKVNRSAKKSKSDEVKTTVDIGVLRSLADCVADIPESMLPENGISRQEDVDICRRKAGMDKIPQLIIYRIDRNSEPRKNVQTREELNMESDIIGLHICVPGDQVNEQHVHTYTVQLPKETANYWENDNED